MSSPLQAESTMLQSTSCCLLSLRFTEVLRLFFTHGTLSLDGKFLDGGFCVKQQESSSKDDGLHRERTEANCCSRDRCGIGYRRWRQIFHYLCWRGVKYSWSRRNVLHDRCRCSIYCWWPSSCAWPLSHYALNVSNSLFASAVIWCANPATNPVTQG